MTTTEDRLTILETEVIGLRDAIIQAIASLQTEVRVNHQEMLAKHDAVMREMDVRHDAVMQVVRANHREMLAKHDAVMRELGQMASSGAMN